MIVVSPSNRPISLEEKSRGLNVLTGYVRSGQWHRDDFVKERGRGQAAGLIGWWAANMETITFLELSIRCKTPNRFDSSSDQDPDFRVLYGRRFQRPILSHTSTSAGHSHQ